MRMIGRLHGTLGARTACSAVVAVIMGAFALAGCTPAAKAPAGSSIPPAGSGLGSQASEAEAGTGDSTSSGSSKGSDAKTSPGGSAAERGSSSGSSSSRTSVVQLSQRYGRIALAEQIASQTNISKLAAGRVTAIDIDSSVRSGSRWVAQVGADFKDGTYGPGELVLTNYEGFWYFTSMTGKRTGTTGGDADSVNDSGVGGTPLELATDKALINIFAQQSRVNQRVYRDMVAGKWDKMDITSVNKGLSTTTLKVSLHRVDGSGSDAGTIGMLRKNKRWYVVRFARQ